MANYGFVSEYERYYIRDPSGAFLSERGVFEWYETPREYKTLQSARLALKRLPDTLKSTVLKANAVIVRDVDKTLIVEPCSFVLTEEKYG